MQVDEEGKAEEGEETNYLRALYFPIDDGQEESNTLYVQFEATLPREYFDALDLEKVEEATKKRASNTGQYLMIFNDESGSMRGQPFASVAKSGPLIADQIFGAETPGGGASPDNMFQMVDVGFYQSRMRSITTTSKREFLDFYAQPQNGGGTDFAPCYRKIRERVQNV